MGTTASQKEQAANLRVMQYYAKVKIFQTSESKNVDPLRS